MILDERRETKDERISGMGMYKLGDLCSDVVDCPHSTPEWKNEGIRVIRNFNIVNGSLDFSNGFFVDEETFEKRTQRACPEFEDLVISREAPMGAVCMIPKNLKCCLGQRLVLLKVNKDVADPNYILFAIQSQFVQKQIQIIDQTGSIVSNLNIPDLKSLRIPLPSLPEQKKIASVLSALDDKIALNKKMNQKLEAMAKRLYDYWFVQYDFPDKNGHPYKTTGGPMTYNETLKREIPAGWEVSFVSDVIKPIDRGISYTSEEIKDSSGIPMINLACFDKKGNYRTGELKFYSGEYDESNKVYPLDILIACTDLTQKADIIGTPIFLSAEAPFYVFSTDLAKITPKNESYKYFLYYYLKNPTFHRYIKPFASGTTVKHLNVKGVENYPIFIPDEKVVKQFTETVRPMVIAINERINEINRLTALRDKLLPLLMNGQVVVG